MKSRFFIGMILGAIIVAVCVICYSKYHNNITNECQSTDETEVIEDSTATFAPTIEEVLEFREQMRRYAYEDSIWLILPKEIITQILIQYGTTLSQYDIVEKYIKNKNFYDGYLKGIKNLQKNNQIIPIDTSISKKEILDTLTIEKKNEKN